MVDFNNETTITTPPKDIIKIMLLERRKYVIDAIEHYNKVKGNGVQTNTAILKSRLIALWNEIKPAYIRDKQTNEKDIEDRLEANNYNSLMESWDYMNSWFDSKRLTMVDTITPYDSTDVEVENGLRVD